MKQKRISKLKANEKIPILKGERRGDISFFIYRMAVNFPKFRNKVLPLHSVTPKKEVVSSLEKSKNSTTPPCKNPKNTSKQPTNA
jgi:hypothetical protein